MLRAFSRPRRASRGGVSRVVRISMVAGRRRFRLTGHPNSSLFSVCAQVALRIPSRNDAGFRATVCTLLRIAVWFRNACSPSTDQSADHFPLRIPVIRHRVAHEELQRYPDRLLPGFPGSHRECPPSREQLNPATTRVSIVPSQNRSRSRPGTIKPSKYATFPVPGVHSLTERGEHWECSLSSRVFG